MLRMKMDSPFLRCNDLNTQLMAVVTFGMRTKSLASPPAQYVRQELLKGHDMKTV